MSLADKILAARERRVTIGKFTFTVRRPSALEIIELREQNSTRALLPYIVNWDGVTEGDLISGGDPHPLTFDRSACDLWLEDRVDLFQPLIEAIVESIRKRQEQEDEEKKA